jgi:hypothetical protein
MKMDFFDLVNEKHIAQEKFAEECGYDTNKMMQEAKRTAIQIAEKYKVDIKFGTPDHQSKDLTEKFKYEDIK